MEQAQEDCVDVEVARCKVRGARCEVPGARRSRELCTEGDLQSRWATATDADADETTGLRRGYAPARGGCCDEKWWRWAVEEWGGLLAEEETGRWKAVEKERSGRETKTKFGKWSVHGWQRERSAARREGNIDRDPRP